jgi:large subunit ribosomal protein L21
MIQAVWVLIVLAVAVLLALVIWWWLTQRGKEKVSPVAEPVVAVASSVAEAPVADNLKRIEGIGPKISSLLQEAGIATFAQLAATDVSRIQEILAAADLRGLADPTTWPGQAKLASEGQWDKLGALQDELKGGRRA